MTSNQMILRGGSWGHEPRNTRASNQSRFDPAFRVINIGFRCVRRRNSIYSTLRSGSFRSDPRNSHTAYRHYYHPTYPARDIGFRCVRRP